MATAQALHPVHALISRCTQDTWFALALLALLSVGIRMYQLWKAKQADDEFGKQHGCLPNETILEQKWPLGLDILKRQWDALQVNHLLAAQSPFLKEMPNMKTHIFGAVGYLTTDPKNIEAMLQTNFNDWSYGSRSGGLYPMLGEGIFTQDGRRWKHSREILRQQFARINFRDLSVFDAHVEHLVHGLRGQEGVVDLQDAFFRFTLATTTSLIFGETIDDAGIEERIKFGESFDYAQKISAIRIRLADLHWLYSPRKFQKACKDIQAYASYFVEEALSNSDSNEDESQNKSLIRDLYRELKDRRLVRDQLMHVLVAGRDTTACTMSWAIHLLVRHPKVLQRLRSEIETVMGRDEKVTRSHLVKMPYLTDIINETLRLYPQLPVNVRMAAKRTTLPRGGGPDGSSPVLIKQGTGVVYSVYHMHRREDLYGPDAEAFRPERWEGNKLERAVGWGFMPFHGGPRLCLGKEFALTEASYGIVSVVRAFPGLRLPPGEVVEPVGQEEQLLGLTVSSAHGCKVLLS